MFSKWFASGSPFCVRQSNQCLEYAFQSSGKHLVLVLQKLMMESVYKCKSLLIPVSLNHLSTNPVYKQYQNLSVLGRDYLQI